MDNEAFKAWVFQDDHDRMVGTMYTEQLRQVLGVDLPKTLPKELPMIFATAEVAEAYMRLNWKFQGMRPVRANVADWAVAFVMVQTVTDEGCWMAVYYKDEEDKSKGWESMPLSMPPGLGKTGFDRFSMGDYMKEYEKMFMFVCKGRQQVLRASGRRGFLLAPTRQLADQYVQFSRKHGGKRISVAEIGSMEGETLTGQLAVAYKDGTADCVFVLQAVLEDRLHYLILEFN